MIVMTLEHVVSSGTISIINTQKRPTSQKKIRPKNSTHLYNNQCCCIF